MQGNSLLESYEGIDLGEIISQKEPTVTVYQADMFEEPQSKYGLTNENRRNIKELVKTYFTVEDKDEKKNIHKEIDTIVIEHIDKSLEFFENRILIEIAGLEQTLKRKIELKQI